MFLHSASPRDLTRLSDLPSQLDLLLGVIRISELQIMTSLQASLRMGFNRLILEIFRTKVSHYKLRLIHHSTCCFIEKHEVSIMKHAVVSIITLIILIANANLGNKTDIES